VAEEVKFPGLRKTAVVVEAELERAGQATAEKERRTNLTGKEGVVEGVSR
jgi:hypothetical protein